MLLIITLLIKYYVNSSSFRSTIIYHESPHQNTPPTYYVHKLLRIGQTKKTKTYVTTIHRDTSHVPVFNFYQPPLFHNLPAIVHVRMHQSRPNKPFLFSTFVREERCLNECFHSLSSFRIIIKLSLRTIPFVIFTHCCITPCIWFWFYNWIKTF